MNLLVSQVSQPGGDAKITIADNIVATAQKAGFIDDWCEYKIMLALGPLSFLIQKH